MTGAWKFESRSLFVTTDHESSRLAVIPEPENRGNAGEFSGTVIDLPLSVLRIETTLETPADVLFRLTGKISEEHLVMLERLLDDALGSGRRVGLDLGAVTLADREAVELLARRANRGVVLERCPAFLREWIRRETEQAAHLRPTVPPRSPEPRAIRDRAERKSAKGEQT